eukprot:scaffold261_cov58-Cyclotella_meneghiniana.AAC.4
METPHQQHRPLISLSRMQHGEDNVTIDRNINGRRYDIRRPRATRRAMWCGWIINGRADRRGVAVGMLDGHGHVEAVGVGVVAGRGGGVL